MTMKQSDFEVLLGRIGSTPLPFGAEVEFSLLCMHSGCGRKEVENRIYSEFGLSGEELVESVCRTI